MFVKFLDGCFFTIHFLSCFILILLPTLLNWEPIISSMDMRKLPIHDALTSNDFRTSLYASLAVSCPMVLKLIFRVFVEPSILFSFYKGLSNIILVIWIIATDVLILSVVIPNQDLMTYTLISHLRVILLIWSVGIYLYSYSENKIWQSKLTVGLFVGVNSTRVIHYYDIFFKTPLVLQQANSAFLGVCYIVILIQCARWYYGTHKIYKSKRIPSKESFCGVYIFATTGIAIGAFYIFCYYRNTLWYEADSSNLCAQTITYTIFYLVYAVFQGNAFEREAQSSKLALEIKQLFIRYMSHEMRSPLSAVMMGLEHLKEELKKTESGDMSDKLVVIEEIEESCGVAIQTLNDMLLHDQIETGSLKVETENIKIIPLIQNVVRQFQFQANQMDIDLSIVYADDRDSSNDTASTDWNNLMISADPKKIAKVFRNLISNALKFTPRTGNVVVRISKSKATNNVFSFGSIKINVIDTGIGISLANQSKLFHGAIQFLPGKLQDGEGSGLGLYISKGIVDEHHGILSVVSAGDGKGSTFTVVLPLLSPVAAATDAIVQYISTRNPSVGVAVHPTAAVAAVEQSSMMNVIDVRRENSFPEEIVFAPVISDSYTPSPLSTATGKLSYKKYAEKKSDSEAEEKLTNVVLLYDIISFEERKKTKKPVILVVDDMASNRKMLRRLLVDRCEYALEAVDGQDAVNIIRDTMSKGEEGRVDVITLDYQMPVMDGPTAANAIRDLGYKGIILGVTGNVLSKDIQTFISAGADTVLTKPLNIKTFDSTILELSMKYESIAGNR